MSIDRVYSVDDCRCRPPPQKSKFPAEGKPNEELIGTFSCEWALQHFLICFILYNNTAGKSSIGPIVRNICITLNSDDIYLFIYDIFIRWYETESCPSNNFNWIMLDQPGVHIFHI